MTDDHMEHNVAINLPLLLCCVHNVQYVNTAVSQHVLPAYMKSWSRNPVVILVVTYDLHSRSSALFKVLKVKHAISFRTWSRSPLVILVLTNDLSFDAI